jgi:hypothetical protein
MKYILLLIFFITFDKLTYAQVEARSLYSDAKLICKNQNLVVLKNLYGIDLSNKFLPQFKNVTDIDIFGETQSLANSNLMNLDVTNFALKLSAFIAGRVKKELATQFFDDFKKKLKDPNARDLHVLFSKTFRQLELIDDQIYNYENYLKDIRADLHEDIKVLPTAIQKLLDDQDSQLSKALDSKVNYRYMAHTAFNFIKMVQDSHNLGKVIEVYPYEIPMKNTDPNLIQTLRTFQLFSTAFKSDTIRPYWISDNEFSELMSDPCLRRTFLGLIAARAKQKGIKFGNVSLYSIMNDQANQLKNFDDIILSFKKSSALINQVTLQSKNLKDDDDSLRLISNYYFSINQIINLAQTITSHMNKEGKHIDQNAIDKWLCIIGSVNNLHHGFSTSNPAITIPALVDFLQCVKNEDKNYMKILKFFNKNAAFIYELQYAKTTEEFIETLEKVAAPIGSWRDKRLSKFNLAIDSYVGGSYFWSDDNGWAVSTPVGLSLSTNYSGFSFSGLFSIIDLGPLTSYKFKTNAEEVAKIYLKEIYSPGIHFSVGFGKNFIFNLNGSYQKFISLKSVGGDQNNISSENATGYSAGITVNVPLMTLVNSKN